MPRYIPSIPKPDQYEDFKKFFQRYPTLKVQQFAGAYSVTDNTIRNWLKKIHEEVDIPYKG